jgi:acyl-CoA reductase-like NAD-dependent aldehyde dehydrogenase
MQIYKTARAAFASGKARSIAFRKEQLSQLAHLISDNRDAFNEAIRKDLGRSVFESNMYVRIPLSYVIHALKCVPGSRSRRPSRKSQ